MPVVICSGQINQWVKIQGEGTINKIVNDCDQDWIATSAGLILYDGQTAQTTFYTTSNTSLQSNSINSVELSLSGSKYIYAYDEIYQFIDNKIKKLHIGSSVYENYPGSTSIMGVDFQENLWYVDENGVLNKYITADSSFFPVEILAGKKILNIVSDQAKNIYFLISESIDSISIYKFDGSIYQFAPATKIPFENKGVFGFFIDSQNRLWITFPFNSYSDPEQSYDLYGGISVYDSGSWNHFDAFDLGTGGFNRICEDDARMLFVTNANYSYDKLFQLNYDGSMNLIPVENGISNKLFHIDLMNRQWYVEDKSILIYNGFDVEYPKLYDIPIYLTNQMTVDKQNQIWASNYHSIVHWNYDHWDVYDETNCPVFSETGYNTISDLHCYGIMSLAVSSSNGLYLFDGITWKKTYVGLSLPYERVMKSRTDELGGLWAISNYNLFHYDAVTDEWGSYFSNDEYVEEITDMEIFDSILFITGNNVRKLNIYGGYLTWNFPGHEGFTGADNFTSINMDTAGNYWFGGSPGIYELSNGITEKVSNHNVYKMVINPATNEKYFIDFDYTLYKFINADSIVDLLELFPGNGGGNSISIDQDNNILLPAGGINVFNEYGVSGNYAESHYFPSNIPAEFCRNYISEASTVWLYPNPAESILNISLDIKGAQETGIKIFNSMGQQVLETTILNADSGITKLSLNTSKLINGIYTLQITNGNKVIGREFIKM